MNLCFKVEDKLNWCVNPMATNLSELITAATDDIDATKMWGRVTAIDSGVVQIRGLSKIARIGDRIEVHDSNAGAGEIIAINDNFVSAMPDGSLSGLAPGDRAYLLPNKNPRPSRAWVGEIISSDCAMSDGRPAPKGEREMPLDAPPPPAAGRRGLGARLNSGLAAMDTFLPICRGQRIGLFAGSGVGKSSLLGELAKGVDADIVIVALIGERSREVREFVDDILGEKGRARSIVFASVCDEPAPSKRRSALLAISAAEYFRDQGLQVLLLFDSITRFADAHREIALTAGETPSLRAYPPSTFRAIASLAERTGAGAGAAGDITAIFSVLVAGSDMEEPIADMVRGILDGHIVLDRSIAERGRYPAIDVRRSVSRSLPKAASAEENTLLAEGRRLLSAYEEAQAIIQTGLYAPGSDPILDRAVNIWPALDAMVSEKAENCAASFEKLRIALTPQSSG